MNEKKLKADDIRGITIPSMDEYLAAYKYIPPVNGWWWLRTPGYGSIDAAVVIDNGNLYGYGYYVGTTGGSVRPALRLNPESDNPQIGDRVLAAGHTWTVIPGNLALCDGSIGEHCFRKDWEAPDANNYEASDIKRYIEAWAHEHGLPCPEHDAMPRQAGNRIKATIIRLIDPDVDGCGTNAECIIRVTGPEIDAKISQGIHRAVSSYRKETPDWDSDGCFEAATGYLSESGYTDITYCSPDMEIVL